MEIYRNRREEKLFLSQKKYIEKVLERYDMKTQFAAHFDFQEICLLKQMKRRSMSHIPYASEVRSIMHAMMYTQSDISHAFSVMSRYMDRPGKGHWQVVK